MAHFDEQNASRGGGPAQMAERPILAFKYGLRRRGARPEAKKDNCGLKNGLRRRRAGREARMPNFGLKMASGGAGPGQRPEWAKWA